MNTETLDKPYIITYSNWFEFNGKILAYRKKVLFDITNTPNAFLYQIITVLMVIGLIVNG